MLNVKSHDRILSEIEQWLNFDVYDELLAAEPKVVDLQIAGEVTVEVPDVWYDDRKTVIEETKKILQPLGYKVEFTDDGVGQTFICIITWTVKNK